MSPTWCEEGSFPQEGTPPPPRFAYEYENKGVISYLFAYEYDSKGDGLYRGVLET
jgi:hypothetical protein